MCVRATDINMQQRLTRQTEVAVKFFAAKGSLVLLLLLSSANIYMCFFFSFSKTMSTSKSIIANTQSFVWSGVQTSLFLQLIIFLLLIWLRITLQNFDKHWPFKYALIFLIWQEYVSAGKASPCSPRNIQEKLEVAPSNVLSLSLHAPFLWTNYMGDNISPTLCARIPSLLYVFFLISLLYFNKMTKKRMKILNRCPVIVLFDSKNFFLICCYWFHFEESFYILNNLFLSLLIKTQI